MSGLAVLLALVAGGIATADGLRQIEVVAAIAAPAVVVADPVAGVEDVVIAEPSAEREAGSDDDVEADGGGVDANTDGVAVEDAITATSQDATPDRSIPNDDAPVPGTGRRTDTGNTDTNTSDGGGGGRGDAGGRDGAPGQPAPADAPARP